MSKDANLYSRFKRRWDLSRPFVQTQDGSAFTYAQADEQAARVAAFLAGLGVEPGERISVQTQKSLDLLWLYLGCLRGGFIFHPLNPAYTESEVEFFFQDAEPMVCVYDPDPPLPVAKVASRCRVRHCFTMDRGGDGSFRSGYRSAPPAAGINPNSPDDSAVLLYSSGTTGRPKGIPLSHDNIGSNAFTLSAAWGFTANDVLLHALPMFHAHGLFIGLGCSLATGSQVRYLSRFAVDEVIDTIPESTVMMGVPTYYTRLLASGRLDTQLCKHMRLFTSGSAPLREDTFAEFEQITGHQIVERYGMSETIIQTTNPIDGARKAGTVGLPLKNVEVRVVDAHDLPLPAGEIGRVQARGPSVFKGYWRLPEKTKEDFTEDGFLDTGDQGKFDDDGYLTIVGRAKDLIISGGLNVYPAEVERVLNEIPGVRESAVIAVPHDDFGEAVVALVVNEQDSELDEAAIVAHAKVHLANFKVPKRTIKVDELPRNTMGKVQKNILKERYKSLLSNV